MSNIPQTDPLGPDADSPRLASAGVGLASTDPVTNAPVSMAPVSMEPLSTIQASTEYWVSELGAWLDGLEDDSAAEVTSRSTIDAGLGNQIGNQIVNHIDNHIDNQLVQVRLGAAASLFAALQCKHAITAGHALRVALSCSAWGLKLGLDERCRDTLEIAALLHDIGTIGVPDRILLKPGILDADEVAVVTRSRHLSLEILRYTSASQEILDIVENVAAWYNGSREGFRLQGLELPLGARMIAIVEAFDAMVTDRVYRPAMSQERAVAEIFRCTGTQFDPELVKQFAEFHEGDQSQLHNEVAARWLNSLDPELVNSYWQLNCEPSPKNRPGADAMFQAKLLDNMYDAVVFIDVLMRIVSWNHGAERLTGIAAASVCQRPWQPGLLSMCDEKGRPIDDADCPVHSAIRSGVQSLRRLTICSRTGRSVSVDTHAIPVMDDDGATLGAILLFHDASSEISLEQRCQSLYEKATKDPMTQVANRAEFDRVHEMFVATHQQQGVPCSLMICDLDLFKQVNDTYGHQAGDDVIQSLAALLKSSCRPGDLVARYGGEEFVVLCADCDNGAATRRAEQIRKALSRMPQRKMEGRPTTVSFGVTEIQPGDTAETMLRRADRALLTAKARGRNRVVQLGIGSDSGPEETGNGAGQSAGVPREQTLEQVLVTPVPIKIAIEKLRGFVADHRARIIKIDRNCVQLEIDEQHPTLRRLTDRLLTFCVGLRFQEEQVHKNGDEPATRGLVRTRIEVSIVSKRLRDRRRSDLADRTRKVLVSLRSYLMASEEDASQKISLRKARQIFAPWLVKK